MALGLRAHEGAERNDFPAAPACSLDGVKRQRLGDARRRLGSYQSRGEGEFAYAEELAEKHRQLAEVEAALAKDIDGIHEPGAIAA